jgi:hypothetical protein
MKITGILACLPLLAAASARADSFSFRDHYFKNSTIDLPGLSLKGADRPVDWHRNAWTFSAVNEGPQRFLSLIDPSQRPVKLAATLTKAAKPRPRTSELSFVRPDETIDYKLAVQKPKPGMVYR